MAQFRLLISLFSLTLPPLFISGVFSSGTVTLLNNCDHRVWPVVGTTANISQFSTDSGFVLQKGQSKIIDGRAGQPNWRSLFWGRTDCAQNQLTGLFTCVTGDCGTGTLECYPFFRGKPATLAEISFDNGLVSYDVSLVDGYNLPILVVPQGGTGDCKTMGCTADLNGLCPQELNVTDSEGVIVACMSPCVKYGNPEYCCSDEYNTQTTCKPTVYAELFKKACPLSFSYPYDNKTTTSTCAGADYLITFCPSPSTPPPSTPPSPSTLSPPSPSTPPSPSSSVDSPSTFKAELVCALDEL